VAKRGSAASLLTNAEASPRPSFPAAAVHAEDSYGFNIPISHVPVPNEMYWNGAHIEEMYPVSTIYDGCAQRYNVLVRRRVGFGYVAGREVVPDIDTLVP